MFSLKTKNAVRKYPFLIIFSVVGIICLAISLHTVIAQSYEPLVKDESVILGATPLENTDQGSDAKTEDILGSDDRPIITTYTVSPGDTLSGIANKFDISVNTIRWANDLSEKSSIRVGQKLTILPVTGIQYTVKKGDTISGIATKFDVSQSAILEYNDLDSENKIVPGLEMIIPDGEPIPAPKPVVKKVTTSKINQSSTSVSETVIKPVESEKVSETIKSNDYYIVPVLGSRLSQGLHDKTAVDMSTPVGTTVRASASGVVATVKDGNNWNGGYGYYLIIKHDNGTETLYAHLSRIDVEVGQSVSQGEAIALSGNTGRSTGPHVHFEVRGATNPFASDKVGTRY